MKDGRSRSASMTHKTPKGIPLNINILLNVGKLKVVLIEISPQPVRPLFLQKIRTAIYNEDFYAGILFGHSM